jgi:NADPH-dependent glutamate synthase beta subunit-like oxidoreductase
LNDVVHAIDFLKTMNIYGLSSVDHVIVIGGEGVAIDAAHTAVRYEGDVWIFYLESRNDVPDRLLIKKWSDIEFTQELCIY